LVEGSDRAWVTVTGDIMAPALANLDKLVTTPYGCGEQNMISVVPNIYLLEYLEGKNVSVPEIERRAKANIVKGWKRQQKYRHKDGSYSIWGPSDEGAEGSMWLTSFVVKSFTVAEKYLQDSDGLFTKGSIKKSLKWIMSNVDNETGCYKNVGYTITSELKGPSLTASVLTAFLSNDAVTFSSEARDRITRGLNCALNRTEEDDVYSKALIVNAANLATELADNEAVRSVEQNESWIQLADSSRAMADRLMEELMAKANSSSSGKLFWTTGKNNKARDVELTAYMVLNMVRQDKLSESLMAIKWLSTHRNSRGGFVSTQDTMVALQAIAEYSKRLQEDEVDLDINVTSESGETKLQTPFEINQDNQLLFNQEKLLVEGKTTTVKAKVSGVGCAMIQTILRYNVKNSPYEPVFELTANTDGETLKLCGSYDGGKDATDMVVIEAELLSGYKPDLSSLRDLVNDKEASAPVKKFEYDEKDNSVALYFNEMPKEKACWEIGTKKDNAIGDLQPAIVKIYDYYDPKETFSVKYNL